jgi:NADPH:quinone reductase-like Zn-dependent oxidoreductase
MTFMGISTKDLRRVVRRGPGDPQTECSLYLTLHDLMGRTNDVLMARELKVRIDKTFPLSEVAEAHRYLEDRIQGKDSAD